MGRQGHCPGHRFSGASQLAAARDQHSLSEVHMKQMQAWRSATASRSASWLHNKALECMLDSVNDVFDLGAHRRAQQQGQQSPPLQGAGCDHQAFSIARASQTPPAILLDISGSSTSGWPFCSSEVYAYVAEIVFVSLDN